MFDCIITDHTNLVAYLIESNYTIKSIGLSLAAIPEEITVRIFKIILIFYLPFFLKLFNYFKLFLKIIISSSFNSNR